MAEEESGRNFCKFCNQELGHSAYYRHLHDYSGTICPGRSQVPEGTSSSESEISNFIMPSEDSESSFDFGSEKSASIDFVHDVHDDKMNCSESDAGKYSDDDSIMSFSISSDEGREVWDLELDDTDDESEEATEKKRISLSLQKLLYGVFFFLNFFHLFFKLSEKAMVALFTFLRILSDHLANLSNSIVIKEFAMNIPKSLYSIQKNFKFSKDDSTEYAVCLKCCEIYHLDCCTVQRQRHIESAACDHVEFPNHPHRIRRQKCGAVLMKSIKVGGKSKMVPRKRFVYHNVIKALGKLAKKPLFFEKCEHWRNRSTMVPDEVIGDIYDGRIWKEFQTLDSRPFLALPNNLCLCLNIDWFDPFEETPYSVGAIYLVVLNLPRTERYKLENVILVGIMPGPDEPKYCNPFLAPMVQDLNTLYQGVVLSGSSGSQHIVRAVLACVSCDLPATRKVCGFQNYNAKLGCSKCLKRFITPSFGQKPNYGGFECDEWELRDNDTHIKVALESKHASSAARRKQIEQSYGTKFSELFNLSSFNVIRSHVIDPMHNIFLGLAKHTIKTWKELEILRPCDYETIQDKVDNFIPPAKIGRIPRKIQAGFISFTADEWKNWILFYSAFCLHQVIPNNHMECWHLLIDSCQILCQPILRKEQVIRAHESIVNFCKSFESLYGQEHCTPNMHMACHLKECILDYGPLSSFWCFPFERYNGHLEGIQKSWKGPEKQMFQKFLDMQFINSLSLQETDDDFVKAIYEQHRELSNSSSGSGSFEQTAQQDLNSIEHLHSISCQVSALDATEKPHQCLVKPLIEKCFTDVELSYLHAMYSVLYPHSTIDRLERFYLESKQLKVNGEDFNGTASRSTKSSLVAAHWLGVNGIDIYGEAPLRIASMNNFIKHEIHLRDENGLITTLSHILVRLQWFQDHPKRSFFHHSIVCCAAVHQYDSPACFMPVSRIAGRCAYTETSYTFDYGVDNVMICVPLLKSH